MNSQDRKFREKYHAMAAELRVLQMASITHEADKARAVSIAVAAAVAEQQDKIDRISVELIQLSGTFFDVEVHSAADRGIIEAQLKQVRDRLVKTEGERDEAIDDRDVWKRSAAETQPRVDAAEAAVIEMKTILDRVSARMRRREIEQVAAIANRRVYAGAVPGGRR